MMIFKKTLWMTAAVVCALAAVPNTEACTGIQLKTQQGATVNGRTVEFGEKIDMNVLVIPRDYAFSGTLPNGKKGLAYRSKYAAVGVGPIDEDIIADGLNEAGLSVGAFYLPGYAGYPDINAQNQNQAVAPFEFVNWLLSEFASVDEVKQNLNHIVIAPTSFKAWGFAPPLHYVVYDKSGKSIVIEPIQGQLRVYDNPLGVITNAPTFDWHMTNLQNYINLSVLGVPSLNIDGITLKQFSQGNGLHGLPGDFTSPSRFVRAAIFSAAAIPASNTDAAVAQVFHILNQFDIPLGSVRSIDPKTGKTHLDYTMLTSVKDPKNGRYYFKTYDNQRIRVINLKDFDLTAKTIRKTSTESQQTFEDIAKQLQ